MKKSKPWVTTICSKLTFFSITASQGSNKNSNVFCISTVCLWLLFLVFVSSETKLVQKHCVPGIQQSSIPLGTLHSILRYYTLCKIYILCSNLGQTFHYAKVWKRHHASLQRRIFSCIWNGIHHAEHLLSLQIFVQDCS